MSGLHRVPAQGGPSVDLDESVRQQWQLTFELSGHGIAVLDPSTGCIERVNPAFARMHGGSPEDFTGRQIGTTLTEEWQRRVPEIVRTIQDRGCRSFECDRVRRDGSTFPSNTEVVVARGVDGEMLYRLVFVTDLTELRAREAAERRAIERINGAAARILAEGRLTALDAIPDSAAPPPHDLQITQPDGTVAHFRYSYSVLHERDDADGPVTLVMIEDHTAEVDARAAAEQLRLLDDHDEIAHNLHDNAIQHLFAIGMTVQSIAATLPDSAQAQVLERTLEDIDKTIRGIRGAIYSLRPGAVSF